MAWFAAMIPAMAGGGGAAAGAGAAAGMSTAGTIGLAATAGATILQTVNQLQTAKETKGIALYNKALADREAKATEATSIQQAREIKRQADLQKSRVLAIAAASGGSALDPDVLNMIAGFDEEGDLAARTALYEGKEGATASRAKGQNILFEGKSRARSLKQDAVGTIMGGTSSFAEKYGKLTDKIKD